MKSKLLFLLCLQTSLCFAQQMKVLRGQVVADTKELTGVNVKNLSSKKVTVATVEGLFSIVAAVGDTLLLTSVQLKPRKIVVEKEAFDYLPFWVRMELKVTQIKEVVVKKSTIDEVSLGIVSKKKKILTPAERRLKTAGDFKPIHLLSILGGSMPFDPVLNKINGRTERIKKEIKIERLERNRNLLSNMYEDTFFVEELKIPQEHVEGFKVFAAESPELENVITSQNTTMIAFVLNRLAAEYLKRIGNEK